MKRPEHYYLKTFLKQEGYQHICIGGYAPFTIEAVHPSGFKIYFRSRGCTSLELYTDEEYELFEDDCDKYLLYHVEIGREYMSDASEVFQMFYHHYSDLRDMLFED